MSQIRPFVAWACALSVIGTMICGAPAVAATPTLAWDGAKRLGVHCLVDPDRLPERRRLQAALCDRLRILAADKAPLPVVILAPGDPGLIASDTAVLLMHANVQPNAQPHGAPLLVLDLRIFRATAAPSELFGASPRAIALPAGPLDRPHPQIDAALTAALAQTLPWRSRQGP